MFLLVVLDHVLRWPVIVSALPIRRCSVVNVSLFFLGASVTCVIRADWVMTMRPTICSHVSLMEESLPLSLVARAAVAFWCIVFLVGHAGS